MKLNDISILEIEGLISIYNRDHSKSDQLIDVIKTVRENLDVSLGEANRIARLMHLSGGKNG